MTGRDALFAIAGALLGFGWAYTVGLQRDFNSLRFDSEIKVAQTLEAGKTMGMASAMERMCPRLTQFMTEAAPE